MKNTDPINSGIGFINLLTLLLIALKFMGYIHCSWWWVLSPIWISAIVMSILMIIVYRAIK